MAHKITDACINCAACESECPVEAISESGDARVIDANTCIDCSACTAVCPTDAIIQEQWCFGYPNNSDFKLTEGCTKCTDETLGFFIL